MKFPAKNGKTLDINWLMPVGNKNARKLKLFGGVEGTDFLTARSLTRRIGVFKVRTRRAAGLPRQK